ncbi:MAG: PAS domain-containing protein [Bacillota bacterium]
MTYVGSDDRVKYLSGHEERIFPRSKSVIGRKVQNCHPPESVEIVEKILNDFKEGIKDSEHFRIQMKGKYIMINYYALKDRNDQYMGTLEVSQDITEINSY